MRKNNIRIVLGDINRAVAFVRTVDSYPHEVYLESDNCCVNAKSVLGVLATDLRRPMMLYIEDGQEMNKTKLITKLQEYIA